MDIHSYLQSLGEKLKLSPGESQKILQEIKGHLVQEAALLEKTGLSRKQAEEQACTDFGDPATIAQGYQKMSSWFFRTSLRVLVLTLVVMVIVDQISSRILGIVFSFYNPNNPFPRPLINIFYMTSYILFAIIVFWIVQKLTFSTKRLRKLLSVTLLTVFFGEFLYNLITIGIGMNFGVLADPKLIISLFISEFIIILLMTLVYFCLYYFIFRKRLTIQ